MINYEQANHEFEDYLNAFDRNDVNIERKYKHTYGVVNIAEYISRDLGLDEEDIFLAKLIALLHDIGRFTQAKQMGKIIDFENIDHAELGVKILYDNGLIRKFIDDNKYDSIIKIAILNHNKYEIEPDLSNRELLHCKIIRDADKTDNFKVKAEVNFKNIANINEETIEEDIITDDVYEDFMNKKQILKSKRKTSVDVIICYIAFIFDYNFSSGLKYIKANNYINILLDRFKFRNEDTRNKMEQIRNCAIKYIEERIKK